MANEVPERMDPGSGELVPIDTGGGSLAVQLASAALNQEITTAKAFPRSIDRSMRNIMTLATLDDETAAGCVYALPRGGKPIRGPSVRLAEIIASQWGNCHVGSRVIAVDRFEKVVIAEGVFLDLETGMKRTAQIQRRIVDKNGRLYNDDMITMTGNAAASIAMREAVLKGVPRGIWWKAYEASEAVIKGDIKTLVERRAEAMKAFATFGVVPEQIFASLEVEGLDDIGLDAIATLTAMYKAIKSGEQTVEDYFPPKTDAAAAAGAAKGTAAKLGDIAKQGQQQGNKEEIKGEVGKEKTDVGKAKPVGSEPAGATAGAEAGQAEAADSGQAMGNGNAEAGAAQEGDLLSEDDANGGFTAAEIDTAFDRGAEAKKKRMSRKATPPEWREAKFAPLLNAWLDGFDRAGA